VAHGPRIERKSRRQHNGTTKSGYCTTIETSMIRGPRDENLEYAILKIIMGWPATEGKHQAHWGDWEKSVRRLVFHQFTQSDLKSAFKRLCRRNVVCLTKAGFQPYECSDNEREEEDFFFRGDPFNATITDEGRSH